MKLPIKLLVDTMIAQTSSCCDADQIHIDTPEPLCGGSKQAEEGISTTQMVSTLNFWEVSPDGSDDAVTRGRSSRGLPFNLISEACGKELRISGKDLYTFIVTWSAATATSTTMHFLYSQCLFISRAWSLSLPLELKSSTSVLEYRFQQISKIWSGTSNGPNRFD